MSTDTLAILLSFLFISLMGFIGIAALIILSSRDTTKIPELLTRTMNTERLMEQLTADVSAETHSVPLQESWRTADGRYEARSFEELLTKMTQDPNSPLTVDEIESIRSVFDKIMGNADDDEEYDL